jgi:hypothetical protein
MDLIKNGYPGQALSESGQPWAERCNPFGIKRRVLENIEKQASLTPLKIARNPHNKCK